jgi:uncharacterized protein YhaN
VRLDSIDLLRYGHFSGRRIELPARQPDLYVIYGDNEAGKSTLLRGISALLFGVPLKTPDTHTFKGPELRIGATISEGAQHFSFLRRKGTSGTLLTRDEVQIPESAVTSFLRELDRDRFEQFFGLNHERLREGGEELLRGQGDVGSALFQAAGLLHLRRLLEKLDSDAKDLFSPRSRTKAISRVIEEYKQAKAEVRKLAISASTVKDMKAELEAATEKLEKLKEESHHLQQHLIRLRRIEGNKPDLARLCDLRAGLTALESIPTLPSDAGRQHDEVIAALANANNQINTLTQNITERETRIQELAPNSLFKAHETEIEKLNAGTNGYVKDVSDRAKRAGERDDAVELAQSAWNQIWTQPVTEAENLKGAYSSKEEILKLVAEHKGVTAELNIAADELKNVTQEQQRLQEEIAHHPEIVDPAGLVAAIEHAKSLGDTDQQAGKLRSDIERFTQDAKREMRKLAQWSGTTEQLENVQTPLLATIDRYSRQWEALAAQRRTLSLQQISTLETTRKKEDELGSFVAKISGAGENELTDVRIRRDQLWQLIRASSFDKSISPDEARARSGCSGELADTFTDHLRKADEIADVRFANAKDVALHDRVVKEITAARADQQRVKEEFKQLEIAERELRREWASEWSVLGPTPLSPAEMKEWMQVRQAVLQQLARAREKQDELQSFEKSAASAAAQVRVQLSTLGGANVVEDEPLPILLRRAETFAKQREREKRTGEDLRRQLRFLSVEKRRATLEDCTRRLSSWSQKWAPHLRALCLPENSTPDQVAKSLAVLEKVLDALKEADRLEYRIKRIGDNIEFFEKKVAQVVAVLDPSCASLSPDAAVKRLHSQLVELGNAETERKTLQEQNEKDRKVLGASREKAGRASGTLEELKALAHCTDEQELETAIAASAQKADKQEEYRRISVGLIERNANADLTQIEHEASAYDLDSLKSEIADKGERSRNLIDEHISYAASRLGELKTEFERLESSEESALQAQKAEDALAQLRPAVEQYLRLRLAADVLERAIESYREKHQGPILTRASNLFSRLTMGRHSGVTSDFGEDDKPVLVAIRHNGERVHVDGLSEGTLDQLYFALRLAAIEDHVQRFAPCPVVLDDLLINSDDTRASAALAVIRELATKTQVLFFTHHRRLADLGMEAGAQMIELSSLAAMATA